MDVKFHAIEIALYLTCYIVSCSVEEVPMDAPLLADLRARVVEAGVGLLDAGLVRGTAGNLSARSGDAGLVAISPTGIGYRRITPDPVPVVDLEGGGGGRGRGSGRGWRWAGGGWGGGGRPARPPARRGSRPPRPPPPAPPWRR